MRKIWRPILISIGIAFAVSCQATQSPSGEQSGSDSPVSASSPEPTLQYQIYELSGSTVHTLLIPTKSQFSVKVALSPTVDTLDTFAQRHRALAVLNGGFFDANNAKTTSYIIEHGQVVADPKLNERLMQNPNLTPYLARILNRSELRRYLCSKTVRYAIAFHNDSIPKDCQFTDALGGGPRLLPKITAQAEGFSDEAGGKIIRDPLGLKQANARTAVGITREGNLLWVMAAQKFISSGTSGLSLPELANFLKTLGVEEAINLDGGSSSSLYYRAKIYYGKVDERGNLVKRPVKSALILQKQK
ncbi:MAG: phosphodiester glycosidase family protein [Microcystaceae cyanobacterium]